MKVDFDRFEANKNKQEELRASWLKTEQPERQEYQNQLEKIFEQSYGFKNSFESMMSVDKDSKPIPWMTYPAIFYIQQLDLSGCHVFEWGAGNSSLFFSKRVKTLTTIESDRQWYEYVRGYNLSNIDISLENADEYSKVIQTKKKKYDVISIDGDIYRRFECACYAVKALNEGGLIILDNSDWLPNTTAYLRDKGFIQVDFAGPGPINGYTWCTSIFITRDFSIPNGSQDRPGFVRGGVNNERD